MKTKQPKYTGRIISIPGNDGYCFIGIDTIGLSESGDSDNLETKHDIFLHKDDCGSPLKVGMTVSFDVVPDKTRGEKHFRAVGAVECLEAELLSPNEAPLPGFMALAPFGQQPLGQGLPILPATPAQRSMKAVPEEAVQCVVRNEPLHTIARDSSVPEQRDLLIQAFLEFLFPTMKQFGASFKLDGSDDVEVDAQIKAAQEDHKALGMEEQDAVTISQVERFRSFRGAMKFMVEENLVRRDTIIPIEYLPDFFMAVPVWFHFASPAQDELIEGDWASHDPHVYPTLKYFCELFPNQNWIDTFLMFNRRMRTMKRYKGDIIPPHVLRRIREAAKLFDHVVIMTPYLDVAGKDWQDLAWIRSIDPYVVGFKKGVPYFFILARFSDSGTFPLFEHLLGDTMEFLRLRKDKLRGFDHANFPYWMIPAGEYLFQGKLGTHLIEHVNMLLTAFGQGKLFDWLRGTVSDDEVLKTKKK